MNVTNTQTVITMMPLKLRLNALKRTYITHMWIEKLCECEKWQQKCKRLQDLSIPYTIR